MATAWGWQGGLATSPHPPQTSTSGGRVSTRPLLQQSPGCHFVPGDGGPVYRQTGHLGHPAVHGTLSVVTTVLPLRPEPFRPPRHMRTQGRVRDLPASTPGSLQPGWTDANEAEPGHNGPCPGRWALTSLEPGAPGGRGGQAEDPGWREAQPGLTMEPGSAQSTGRPAAECRDPGAAVSPELEHHPRGTWPGLTQGQGPRGVGTGPGCGVGRAAGREGGEMWPAEWAPGSAPTPVSFPVYEESHY